MHPRHGPRNRRPEYSNPTDPLSSGLKTETCDGHTRVALCQFDKLEVTGSSPVTPINKSSGNRGFFCRSGEEQNLVGIKYGHQTEDRMSIYGEARGEHGEAARSGSLATTSMTIASSRPW